MSKVLDMKALELAIKRALYVFMKFRNPVECCNLFLFGTEFCGEVIDIQLVIVDNLPFLLCNGIIGYAHLTHQDHIRFLAWHGTVPVAHICGNILLLTSYVNYHDFKRVHTDFEWYGIGIRDWIQGDRETPQQSKEQSRL